MTSNPYTKGYFENREGSHYSGYEDWPQFKDRAEWIKKEYNPKAVIEIGAAKGFLIKHLQELGIKAYGVDTSEYAASESEGRVICEDITKVMSEYQKGVLVVSFDVLEHIAEEDLPWVFRNLKTAERQFHMITTNEYHFGGDSTHVSMHDLPWWQKRFEDEGIKNFRLIHAGQQEGLWI